MEDAKEKISNISATAKAGMDKTKAAAEEKVEKMMKWDPLQIKLAEERKQEKIRQAELEKQQAYKQNAMLKGKALHTGAGHQTGLTGQHAGVAHQTGLGGHHTGIGHQTGSANPTGTIIDANPTGDVIGANPTGGEIGANPTGLDDQTGHGTGGGLH